MNYNLRSRDYVLNHHHAIEYHSYHHQSDALDKIEKALVMLRLC